MLYFQIAGETCDKKATQGTSLAVQWLRFCASNAKVLGLIPDSGTKIPHAGWRAK